MKITHNRRDEGLGLTRISYCMIDSIKSYKRPKLHDAVIKIKLDNNKTTLYLTHIEAKKLFKATRSFLSKFKRSPSYINM